MRILGLDIGHTQIKAVEIDSAFGRFEVHEYHERAVPADFSPFMVVRDLIQSLPKTPDKVVLALPSSKTTLRNLEFPTKDRRAILASVGFELDDDLPFELDDASFTHSILHQTATHSKVHVVATLKTHLKAALEEWKNQGLDPEVVTTEAWAFRALMNRVLATQAETAPVILLDVGETRTLLYVHHKGVPVLIREIAIGGRDLTASIQERYKIGPEQASGAKLEHGFILPPSQRAQATPEQIEFSTALEVPIRELVREVRHVNLITKNLVHELAAQLYIAGGTSALPGLGRFLEEEVKTPVQVLKSLSSISSSGVAYGEGVDATFGLAAGLALTLVGQDKAILLNLRIGEFAKDGAGAIPWQKFKKPLMGVSLIAASLVVSLVVQSSIYKSRTKILDTQLDRQVKSFFPSVSSSAVKSYLNNPSNLKKDIQRELAKRREAAALMEPNKRSPLKFLKEISSAVSKSIVVDMVNIQVGASPSSTYIANENPNIAMTFWVSSPAVIDQLAPVLEKRMTGLSKSKPEEVSLPDQTKRWKVVFGGKPFDEGYGN